jgi:hypothetical protein
MLSWNDRNDVDDDDDDDGKFGFVVTKKDVVVLDHVMNDVPNNYDEQQFLQVALSRT